VIHQRRARGSGGEGLELGGGGSIGRGDWKKGGYGGGHVGRGVGGVKPGEVVREGKSVDGNRRTKKDEGRGWGRGGLVDIIGKKRSKARRGDAL